MSYSASPLMFLAHEAWSNRFEKHFFTVRVVDAESHMSAPESSRSAEGPNSNVSSSVPGKKNHPAYYYKIEISMGHDRIIVYRRYSQFHWLYQQLSREIDTQAQEDNPLVMPPKSCFFHVQDEKFAKNRMEQLHEFLEDLLQRPRASSHPAVLSFLELP